MNDPRDAHEAQPEPEEGERRPGKLGKALRAAAINASLVLVSFGVAFLFAEVAVRIVAPQQLILIRPDLWEPADTVGWLLRPEVTTRINTGERDVTIYTDTENFRVGRDGRVTAGLEVLLLGDSFMEALQVDYAESGAGLLEATLPEMVGGPVAVRNAGVGGWDPDQYLLRARSLVSTSDFDLIITAIYLGNDVIARRREYLPPREPAQRHHFHLPNAFTKTEFTHALLMPLNDFLEVRSHLYIFFRSRLATVRMALGLSPLLFPPQFLLSEADSERWDVTARLLDEINELARRHDIPALFLLVPTKFQVDSNDLRQYVQGFDLDPASIDLEQPNRKLMRTLEAQGLDVHDLLPAFREAHAGGEHLYGDVDPHFSPAGNRLFAELVAPLAAELLKRQAIPRP